MSTLLSQNLISILFWSFIALALILLGYYFIRRRIIKKNPFYLAPFWRWDFLSNKFFIIEIILSSMIVIIALLSLTLSPKVASPSDPAMGFRAVSDSLPLCVQFDRNISSKIQADITPTLPGEWDVKYQYFKQKSQYCFAPSQTPIANTRYTVALSNIKNVFGFSDSKYLFSFQSPPLPEISSINISDGDLGVLPDQIISLELDSYQPQSAVISFSIEPEIELRIAKNMQNYEISAENGFVKGQTYTMRVLRTPVITDFKNGQVIESGEQGEIKKITFSIITAPSVESTSPSGSGVLTDTPIAVKFKQDMDRLSVQSGFSLTPQASGQFAWNGERSLTYNLSENLAKNTTYQVKISGAKTSSGEALGEDVVFSFTTIGYVAVASFSPANGAKSVETSLSIKIAFNQAVDRSSAEGNFSISPQASGTFSWSSNTLSYRTNLESSTSYTVKISKGVKSLYGLDSREDFWATFTTKVPQTMLSVPSYRQAHMYSCMAVAARNALAFKGVSLSESALLSRIGYDSTPWSGTWAEGGAVWGDPDGGIVGDIDGKANNIGWGYGSHWSPVAAAINSFGRTAEVKSGWDVAGIASEIAAGNPVIVWWVNGVWPAYEVRWKTPSGKSVRAVNSMHVQVVKGFTGTVDNPQAFTVTDSGYGYPTQTFDVGTFRAKWGWFGNTAVIVR